MNQANISQRITSYLRKLDGHGFPAHLSVFIDCLWSDKQLTGIIKQWNSDGKCIRTLLGHSSRIMCLFVWKDNLYSASYDGTISIWNTGTGQHVKQLIGHSAAVNALTEWRGSIIS